jgi:hypothetical protein
MQGPTKNSDAISMAAKVVADCGLRSSWVLLTAHCSLLKVRLINVSPPTRHMGVFRIMEPLPVPP